MAKETSNARTRLRKIATVSIFWLIGGTAWWLLDHVSRYVPLLKNVTDGGPIEVGGDLAASIFNHADLVAANIIAGIVTFSLGGTFFVMVVRAVATSFRDQVFPNLARRVIALYKRTRVWISRRGAIAAAKLENYRSHGNRATRALGFLQQRLETVIAATSKDLRNPQIVAHPKTDPAIRLRVAGRLSSAENEHALATKRQPLIQNFGAGLRSAEFEIQEAQARLRNRYANYNGLRPKSYLERQIAEARKTKERAEENLCVATICEEEDLQGIDQIREETRQTRDNISTALSAIRSQNDGQKLALAAEDLLRTLQPLNRIQDRYPTANTLEAAVRTVEALEANLAGRQSFKGKLQDEIRLAILERNAARANRDTANTILQVANAPATRGRRCNL
jgi:hypothetical protein